MSLASQKPGYNSLHLRTSIFHQELPGAPATPATIHTMETTGDPPASQLRPDAKLLKFREDFEAGALQTAGHDVCHANQGHDKTQLFLGGFAVIHQFAMDQLVRHT